MHQLNRASVILFLLVSICSFGQSKKTVWDSLNTSAIKFRSVGPAFMTGRIADVAIDPKDEYGKPRMPESLLSQFLMDKKHIR